jgi:hypothetical protein
VLKKSLVTELSAGYDGLLSGIAELLQRGRQHAAKSVNAVLTATYWSIGRRLVEYEQDGKGRAAYGSELLKRLSRDLQSQLGRGFSERNLEQMRQSISIGKLRRRCLRIRQEKFLRRFRRHRLRN